jgi:hypothetical protein
MRDEREVGGDDGAEEGGRMNDLRPITGILIGVAIGVCMWAGIGWLAGVW